MRPEKTHWLDRRRNVDLVFHALITVCALLVLVELAFVVLAIWFPDLEWLPHFRWEGWFGFHAVFGFAAFWFAVIAGKHLRKILMRDEDYYDR